MNKYRTVVHFTGTPTKLPLCQHGAHPRTRDNPRAQAKHGSTDPEQVTCVSCRRAAAVELKRIEEAKRP